MQIWLNQSKPESVPGGRRHQGGCQQARG
jgi:hypothetical protein